MFGLLNIKNEEAYDNYRMAFQEFEKNARPVYKKFIKIRKKTEDYTYTEEMQAKDQKWIKKGGEVKQAKRLLELIKLQEAAFCVNPEGIKTKKFWSKADDLCDRGPSDWLALEIITMIRDHKDAKDDTLVFNLSNHAINYYKGPQSVGKNLTELAQERNDFFKDPILAEKGIKSYLNTRSMHETYQLFAAMPDGEEKTKALQRYRDLLQKQYESHTLIHQEGHVVTTHAFVSKETEQAWRFFLHRLDLQKPSNTTFKETLFRNTSLHLQSGEAYRETIAKINTLTKDYLIYQMTNQKSPALAELNDKELKKLAGLISHTANEREKPFHPPMIHGGFPSLEAAGFVPPEDLCKGETPHINYGHTGGNDKEPANGPFDTVLSEKAPFLKKLHISCINNNIRKYEEWQNLYVLKKGKDGKPHKENPIVIIE
jgi:hypothetical protein